ncbi:pleckstrin homology domain-containing family A member 6 isoform X3 [Platichthys flesus]|uniref:pleckstrin homology domain-containing family A member 6 isoform X3 n=1 Tax=Platichthys flesus TaxID=8260 RepID=UPI002DBB1B02|nr:pleckstrin homology domain-containing family A member 6 isoform X3 [Platichthys flesus]
MELEATSRRTQLVRMEDQDRVSQSSSVATISYFPVRQESDGKVQAFGKRCQAAKRDPNCPVVIRGWLNKKDSSGLKLWKRRWFVLSNYCLFYYKDSREELVLGSIPLPSYKILFCTPRECKNRKFTFKVVHQGMRSYFFSADTQEDMLGWVRALSQSASMDGDSYMNRRCSSYQDFTQIGGSSESVDFPKSPSDGEGPSQKHRHVSRTVSEPSQLSGGRMGTSHSQQRGRRRVRHRNSSPSNTSPSPPEFSRRRACAAHQEEDSFLGLNTPPTETMGTGSLTSRGQLGSRPHTPVGRVDIRPYDELVMPPQTLYYAPSSPNLEFKSTPTTPVTERWQSKPTPTYGSVHHMPGGRRPLGKAQKPDPREAAPIRPLESDADALLTRLCGCDKLLQSLSIELSQLQMDKDSVHCALEVSRLQLDEWQSQGPSAQEEALIQKALLQEDLVTIRARMCDASLEIERVWSQYERMESELSVLRSHLQHICTFGMPQEQSQAQRELWMMEDILAGLKVNRDHFRFMLGLQRHHVFQPAAPHPGSPGSPTKRQQSGLPMDEEQEPPARPALPQELQESQQSRDQGHDYTESLYEGIYSHTVEPAHRRGNRRPDLLIVKAQRDKSESQSGSKWNPADSQSSKKAKMSEEEQIERMKRNQQRMTNRKKPPMSPMGTQSQGSDPREEAPFPLRVTRVVTAVLPSSLVARRVSVEDPPAELDNPLPEQIPPELQQRPAEHRQKLLNKPPRRLLPESPDQNRYSVEMHRDQPVTKTSRQQHPGALRSNKTESRPEASRAECSRNPARDHAGLGNESVGLEVMEEERPSALLTPDMDSDLCLTPEQREAKLRRVERIRERVVRSAVRESATTHSQLPIRVKGQEVHQVPPDTDRKQRIKSDHEIQPSYDGYGNCVDDTRSPAELQLSSGTSQDEDERDVKKCKSQIKIGDKTQRKHQSGRTGFAKTKIKRPASPYHITSMTVYQKDRGLGFMSCKVDEEEKLEETADEDNESNFSSSDLRAKWFLSTSQWQGFTPLHNHGIDSLCTEEATDIEQQAASTDYITDSTEMSPAVSESLEKMKENHSLFYKIACDISISDTDITKNDGNTNALISCQPEEEEELLITESEELTSDAERFHNQGSILLTDQLQDPTVETNDEATLDTSEKVQEKKHEDSSGEDTELKVKVNTHEASAPDSDSHRLLDECAKERHDSWTKESCDRKVDQEGSEELRKPRSLSEESKETVRELGDNSMYKGRGLIRSASFGKARVTVLRTSL